MKKFIRIITLIVVLCLALAVAACDDPVIPHSHIAGDSWQYDATQHWNACLNGECEEKQNVANHTANTYGVCTVCGYDATDVSTLAKAVDVATARGALVTNGTVHKANSEYEEDVIFEKAEYATRVFTFTTTIEERTNEEYGYTYTVTTQDYTDTWYIAYGEEDDQVWVYGREEIQDDTWTVVDYDYKIINEEVTKASLGGYNVTGGELTGNYEASYYGAEQVLKALYDLKANAIDGTLTETMENGVYGFTFDYAFEAVEAWDTDTAYRYIVNFTLGDAYTISTLDVTVETYYDVLTIEDAAVPSLTRTYNFEQYVGAYVNCPLNPAEVLATDFALEDAYGTAITDTVTLDQGVLNDIVIVDAVPSTADFALDAVTVTAIDDQDMPVEFGWEWEDNYYGVDGNTIEIKISALGTYTVTISTMNVEKTITVEVVVPVTRELNFTSRGNEVTTLTGNVDSAVNFNVVANAGADASATVTLTAPAGSAVDTTLVGSDGAYTFTPDVVGTYTVTAVSTVDDTIRATLTITVEEAISMADVLSGTYTIDATTNAMFEGTVTFTPDEEPTGGYEITGTATLEMEYMNDTVLNFEYHSMLGFQCSNGDLYIELDGTTLSISNENYGPFFLVRSNGGGSEETSIADTLVDDTYSGEVGGTTWYISFTKYEEEYTCQISDVYMNRPTNAAQYTYTVGEPDDFGVCVITLTGTGTALDYDEIVYYDGVLIVRNDAWDEDVTFILYIPFESSDD